MLLQENLNDPAIHTRGYHSQLYPRRSGHSIARDGVKQSLMEWAFDVGTVEVPVT